jgi:hypothetical protein
MDASYQRLVLLWHRERFQVTDASIHFSRKAKAITSIVVSISILRQHPTLTLFKL